jgi:signal transduction histidine kinase
MKPVALSIVVRRLWPRRVRARLAVLYAVLFLLAGSALLALTYTLLASRLPASASSSSAIAARNEQLAEVCRQREQSGRQFASVAAAEKCKVAFAAGARAGSTIQRNRTLSKLLDVSLIGLGVATLVSAGLGWLISGRALRPVRSINEAARRASELRLGQRLAPAGPDDELKQLADTFDVMLERLDAAFTSQKRFVANAAHE